MCVCVGGGGARNKTQPAPPSLLDTALASRATKTSRHASPRAKACASLKHPNTARITAVAGGSELRSVTWQAAATHTTAPASVRPLRATLLGAFHPHPAGAQLRTLLLWDLFLFIPRAGSLGWPSAGQALSQRRRFARLLENGGPDSTLPTPPRAPRVGSKRPPRVPEASWRSETSAVGSCNNTRGSPTDTSPSAPPSPSKPVPAAHPPSSSWLQPAGR